MPSAIEQDSTCYRAHKGADGHALIQPPYNRPWSMTGMADDESRATAARTGR